MSKGVAILIAVGAAILAVRAAMFVYLLQAMVVS